MRLFLRLTLMLCLSCSASALRAETLTVAVAANMQYAFEALAAEFRQQTGITIQAIYGSSGKLSAQIQHGAPYDLFISADTSYPESVERSGLAAQAPRVYAYGKLVLWTMRKLPLDARLTQLNDPRIQRIALPNPEVAPYGREALRALDAGNLGAALKSKLVYGESIGQAAQYIYTGAVDVGFTALAVVRAPEMQDKGVWVEVDPTLYTPIAQALVLLKSGVARHPQTAPQLMEYLFSPAARAVLSRYGYGLAQ